MKKRKFRRGACLLLIAGLLAAALSLGVLCAAEDSLQYVVPSTGGADALQRALKAKEETAEQLADCTAAVAVGAVTETASISAGEKSASASVYAVGEGWFEVYPVFMLQGRRLTETELREGERVALLDSELAFSLFGAELPPDAQARIGKMQYHVVGTIRHSRSVGDVQAHSIYVPLTCDVQAQRDALMLVAAPIPNSGAQTMFERAMRSAWRSDGSFYSIRKEALRLRMLPRMLLLLFGMSAIFALLRRLRRALSGEMADYREKLRWNYFPKTLPALLILALKALLGFGGLLALIYAIVAFSAQPLTVFTEWVPENFVKWSSLKKVFWNLSGDAAKLVKVGTRELRRLEFWGRILRWGTICALAGMVLLRRYGGKIKNDELTK